MQFLLPARLASPSHQLESQRPRCDISADSDSVSLATAGGASPVQVQSSKLAVTSVKVHVRVRALPIVMSESRYMTSVQHSKSVVVSGSDQLPSH